MRARFAAGILLGVFLQFLASASGAATTYGPTQFMRTPGAPQTFTATFSQCAGSPCQLIVVNGAADGSHRMSSAEISLNGTVVVSPRDFNQRVDRIAVPVSLQDTDQLKVVLSSSTPGSYLTISVECEGMVALRIDAAPEIPTSMWPDGTVAVSIPLENQGSVAASNVVITGIAATGGTYAGPTPFAYSAGTIDGEETRDLAALFTSVDATRPFALTVNGTYGSGGAACPFHAEATVSPPPAPNGGTPKSSRTVPRMAANTAVYPLAPPPVEAEPNAENRYVPPLGPPRNLFTSAPSSTTLDRTRAFNPVDAPPPGSNASQVLFFRNANGGSYGGLPPDPSVAGSTPGGFAMISANTAVSYSTDRGQTFTTVNLTGAGGFSDPAIPGRTDFFPQDDGGLCCDQVLHYIPSRNLMVWLLQYWSPNVNVGGLAQKGQNRLRIAWATPEAAAADFLHAWSWFDVSPTTLGDTTATDWMDYPDLAYSNDWLYISVDHGFWNAGLDAKGNVIGQQVWNGRRWFVRASLADMAGTAGTINLVYYEALKTGVVKAHFAQSAPNAMYFAAQPNTSRISVFADPDASPNVPTPKDIDVTSYCKATSTSPCDFTVAAPDGQDWNVAPHGVLGGAYVEPGLFCPPGGCSGPTHYLYFAFDGGRDAGAGRAFPYVRVEKLDADALTLIGETDIWNSAFAFATPGMTWRPGSRMDEVALSLAVGGGSSYADNAVGFLGDFEVFMTTSSNTTQSNGAAVRYGDYFNVRNAFGAVIPNAGQGVGYSTAAYSVTQAIAGSSCAVAGCNVGLRYTMFGRNADLFPAPVIVK